MRFRRKTTALIVGFWILALATGVQAAEFSIDPAHSSVAFRVMHVAGKVTGHFDKFSGTFNFEANKPAAWTAVASQSL